jgi:putative nucleotidyltransferase with HDIG domain
VAAVTGSVALLVATWTVITLFGGAVPALIELMIIPAVGAGLLLGARAGLVASAVVAVASSPIWRVGSHPSLSSWALTAVLSAGLAWLAGARTFLLQEAASQSGEMATQIRTTHQRTLHLISEAIELRDPTTAGHSRRVAVNASRLGAALGLDEEERRTLYWAGLLHDVGKIAVPEPVLQKPGTLTPSEWEVIRQHPRLGADLIREADIEQQTLADAVATHHERWDGSGYPEGLAGDSIPFYGRILAIVDVFEALTALRPYRAPLSPEEACKQLRDGSGSLFDPGLVGPFETLLHDGALVVAAVPRLQATFFASGER